MIGVTSKVLSDVCEISMGQAPVGASYNTTGDGFPLIAGAGDFGEITPSPGKWTNAPTKISETGDIILCIRATIGDRNLSDIRYCLGRGVAGLRAKAGKLESRYLWHWLGHAADTLKAKGRGATFLQVSKADIASLEIPLPPLAEQKRIAATLDTADDLRTKRRESLTQLDTLLQSTFLDMFGDPVTNPKGWDKQLLGDWLTSIDSGWSPRCLDRSANDDEWGILKLGAVTWCAFNENEQKALPPEESPRPQIEVFPGDLLFARKNTHDLVAAVAYVERVRPHLMLPDLIFRLRLDPAAEMLPKFLWQLMIHPRQRREIQALAGGSAGSMPNISKAKLKTVSLIKPPIAQQRKFSEIVDSIAEQRHVLEDQLSEIDTLFVSLQSRAFRGEL